ncbi:MAG: M1 family metallopeptidase [bacterium]|nr:MAG: M1 family metallopeptidase [bacterium]
MTREGTRRARINLHSAAIGAACVAISGILGLATATAGHCQEGPAPGSLEQDLPLPVLSDRYWQQKADYEIHVTLDPSEHTLTGTETITYTNNSPDTLDIFYLHLYPNAYRDRTSQLIRDYMKGTFFFFVGLPKSWRGWIDVTALSVDDTETEFTVDGTILESAFPIPLAPGKTATIELTFTEKIRKRRGRAGYRGRHYDLAQWYPKMVVYDKRGWHPDQFRQGEFYGEFGTFDVHITLPEEYVVAATGVPVSGDPGWEKNPLRRGGGGGSGMHPMGGGPHGHSMSAGGGEDTEVDDTKTVHFRAEKVHDFAWSADPTFVVQDTTYNDIHVMSIFRSWNRSWADSVLVRTLRSVRWLEGITGPYPYPQLSIVDCPTHGGMEYPMFVMNGNADEGLIFHEVGHIYFYAALANNERDEAWLDEGLTQYQTFWYTERRFGPNGEPQDRIFPFSLFPRGTMYERLARPVINLHRTDFAERVATPAHEFQNSYHTSVYVKAPLFLRALHYTVGDENFRKILTTYFERWKFKHVDEEAFRSVCEEISEMDLKDLFKQWLHSTKDCDYRISRFKVKQADEGYTAEVKINRKGELIMPITLAFRLKNGNTVTEREDGYLRTFEKTYTFDTKPVSLSINPDNEILDIYQIDNHAPRRRDLTIDIPFVNTYYPPDAFSYRFAPTGYYNDIDGGKAGMRLRGSYDNTYKRFVLQVLYGIESEQVDVYGSFAHPLKYFGRDCHLSANGFYREGRQGAFLNISKILRNSLADPLPKHLDFWASYHEITDLDYVFPFTYEEGRTVKLGLRAAVAPKTDLFATSFSFTLDRTIWWSDFEFEKTSMEAKLWPARRYPLPVRLYLRFFLGYSSIDPPMQERFNLAGAGVLDKERYFWLRSVGAFPKDYYNNFHLPGDANLRGYYDGDYSFSRIFASNVELQVPCPLPIGRRLLRRVRPRLFAFYDWGKVMDKHPMEAFPGGVPPGLDETVFDGIIFDFGVGLRLWRIYGEFPLYLSNPEIAGETDEWDFRWKVGFWSLF